MPSTSTAQSPITHAQSIAALKAGKHVACTVPIATTLDELHALVRAAEKIRQSLHDDGNGRVCANIYSSRSYTTTGELGRHSVPARQPSAGHGRLARLLARPAADALRDALRQPMPGDRRASWGRKRRLSRLRPNPGRAHQDNTTVRLPWKRRPSRSRDRDVVAEVTRSLFDVARQYRESFDVTGSVKSFEWQQVENEEPVIHTRGLPETSEDSQAGKGSRLCEPAAGTDPKVHATRHDSGCGASIVLAGWRARWKPSSSGSPFFNGSVRKTAGDAGRGNFGQLDCRWDLCSSLRDERRRPHRDS